MKYLILLILLSSCSLKNYPIRGNYPKPPLTYQTNSPIEKVWSNIIDFIATSGMTIKVIDKSSGILVTEDYSFKSLVTFENKKTGIVNNPHAYLVSSWIYNPSIHLAMTPDDVIGNWNIRIKEEQGKTSININITNVRSYDFITVRGMTNKQDATYDIRTTGVFENMIYNTVK